MLGSERNPWALHPKEYACAKESWGSGAEREVRGCGGECGGGAGGPYLRTKQLQVANWDPDASMLKPL